MEPAPYEHSSDVIDFHSSSSMKIYVNKTVHDRSKDW